MDHLGEVAVWFSLFLDRGLTFPTWGKVRLGSVRGINWLHEHLTLLAELGDGIHIPGLVGHLGGEAVGFLLGIHIPIVEHSFAMGRIVAATKFGA